VRVAAHELARDARGHLGEVEAPFLLGDAREQEDAHQEIARLLGDVTIAPGLDRLLHLVGLLDEMRRDRREGLRPVPRTAVGGAQPVDDEEQLAQRIGTRLAGGRGEVDAGGRGVGLLHPRILGDCLASVGLAPRPSPGITEERVRV
jgi:hypothetical protein